MAQALTTVKVFRTGMRLNGQVARKEGDVEKLAMPKTQGTIA